MVFSLANPNPNPNARLRVRVSVRVGVTFKMQDFFIQISLKDESLTFLVKTNLSHLISNFEC